jgi:hypothetical protein
VWLPFLAYRARDDGFANEGSVHVDRWVVVRVARDLLEGGESVHRAVSSIRGTMVMVVVVVLLLVKTTGRRVSSREEETDGRREGSECRRRSSEEGM